MLSTNLTVFCKIQQLKQCMIRYHWFKKKGSAVSYVPQVQLFSTCIGDWEKNKWKTVHRYYIVEEKSQSNDVFILLSVVDTFCDLFYF